MYQKMVKNMKPTYTSQMPRIVYMIHALRAAMRNYAPAGAAPCFMGRSTSKVLFNSGKAAYRSATCTRRMHSCSHGDAVTSWDAFFFRFTRCS